jgi:TRAP-type C4-dicarboxylate transport system permease small subunit
MALLHRMLERLARAMLLTAAAAALAMTALVVLASIMRYVVGAPFRFTEELVALLYASMMFLSIPLCTFRRQHISVPLIVEMVGPRARRVLALLASVVTLVFAVWFVIESWKFAAFARELGSRSEQVDFLLWPWMMLMPGAMAVVAVIVTVQLFAAGSSLFTGEEAATAAAPVAGDPL